MAKRKSSRRKSGSKPSLKPGLKPGLKRLTANLPPAVWNQPRSIARDGLLWPDLPQGNALPVMALQVPFLISERLPPDRLLEQQMLQIRALIHHARETVPYYRDRLADVGDLLTGPLTMDRLRTLPILSRGDIQDAGDRFVTEALPKSHGKMFDISTSGSTGRPLELKGTTVTGLFFAATSLRYHLWHRRDFAGKSIQLKTLGPDKNIQRYTAWTPGVRTGPALVINHGLPTDVIFKIILEQDPHYLQAFPSTVVELIRLSKETGGKPKSLREVRTVSEILNPEVRDLCRTEWGVPVSNNYSCEEVGILALQCPDHEHLHVQAENCLIEVLDEDGIPCAPGRVGRVVLTALNNFATPLIRYEIGDMAEAGSPCACGRGFSVLNRIIGRRRNLVALPSGQKATPTFGFLKSELGDIPIRQFQFIQKSVELIELCLVVERPLRADEEDRLRAGFNSRLRHDFRFQFTYVDDIPRLASGKYEEFRCDVVE